MSTRIDGNFQPQLFQTSGSEGTEQTSGNLNGRQVSVQPNAMSLLADAAEELTFSAQETQEKKISERKLREEKGSAERFERVEKLLEKLGDLEKSDLERFLDAMKQEATTRNLNRLLGDVKDPTHRHAMLSYAKEMLGESSPEARTLVEKALTELMEQEGPAVRAGYNIAGIKGDAFLGDQGALRSLYRGTVLDYQSFTQAFDKLAERYGAAEFPSAIEFLIRALSADMAATTPSTTMSQMKNILDDLYMLEVLKNFYTDSEKLLERLVEFCGKQVDRAKPQDIMSPVLRLKDENFVQSSQLTAVMPFLVSENPPCDVQFLQGLKNNVRKLPHKIFNDTDKRYNLLDAIQDLLDDAIDREEEMEF